MGMIDDFEKWVAEMSPELDHVFELLGKRLNDQPELLIQDLIDIDAWQARLGYLQAEANWWLDSAIYFYRPEREEGKTEFDRKIILDGHVIYFRKVRDRIEAVCQAIRQRLVLGGGLLSYHRVTGEPRAISQGDRAS